MSTADSAQPLTPSGATRPPAGPGGGALARSARGAVALAFFAQGFIFITMTTHLPHVQAAFGLDSTVLSLLLLGMVLLAGVGSVLAGAVASRRGSASALRLGLALIGTGAIGAGLAQELSMFCVALAIYGLGLGVVDASGNMQGVALEHLRDRPLLPGFFAAWTCGGILATLAALAWGDVPLALSVTPFGALALAIMAAAFLPRGGDDVAAQGAAVSENPAVLGHDVDAVATARRAAWARLWLIGVVLVLFYMVDTAASTWGPAYLHDLFGTSLADVAVATLPYLVASLAARMAGDRLVARYGAVALLRVAAVVSAAALAVIVLAPTAVLAVLGFFVLGLGAGLIAPLSFSAAGAVAAEVPGESSVQRRARVDAVIARFNQFNYAGALLGAVLTGIVGADSLRYGFAVPLVLILLIWPLARAFPGRGAR